LGATAPPAVAAGEVFIITEFMAANQTTLEDEDGDDSDWIEIHNETLQTNNLDGWYLTDTTVNLRAWRFPATNLPPNGDLIVFASGKNHRVMGRPLHTNFKLRNTGDYLALVRPDGTNVASEFAPAFPPQAADVSYGVARDTASGTRCAVYFAGEFYDNVFCRARGASAATYPKKPYKFDFNPGSHFRLFPDAPRMDEINLNATYQDKAYVRQPLTFETYRQASVPACDAFNVRVQQNAQFYSLAVLIEQVDETFLERLGLDPRGALYMIFNGLDSASSNVEKKTRRTENNNDLQQLVNGVSRSNPNRGMALFDLLDLPEIINYLAAGMVAQDWDRVIKNICVYRDTEGTGLWQMLPWDKDLSFGKVSLVNDTVTATRDSTSFTGGGEPHISHPFYGTTEHNCCGMNHLFDAIYKTPATRDMYLRRLRTLMDALLQPPGTPAGELQYERRLATLSAQLQNDAATNLTGYVHGFSFGAAAKGVSFGRHLNSVGEEQFVAQTALTLGRANAGPRVGPAVISEIMYHPPDWGVDDNTHEEFVEIRNVSGAALPLFDPLALTNTWRLNGSVEFDFPPGMTLAPGASVLVVGFDPSLNAATLQALRNAFGLDSSATVLGPFSSHRGRSRAPRETDLVRSGFFAPHPGGRGPLSRRFALADSR
jgi:hypothetical protein